MRETKRFVVAVVLAALCFTYTAKAGNMPCVTDEPPPPPVEQQVTCLTTQQTATTDGSIPEEGTTPASVTEWFVGAVSRGVGQVLAIF